MAMLPAPQAADACDATLSIICRTTNRATAWRPANTAPRPSRPRYIARDSIRFATLAQAISSTKITAPITTMNMRGAAPLRNRSSKVSTCHPRRFFDWFVVRLDDPLRDAFDFGRGLLLVTPSAGGRTRSMAALRASSSRRWEETAPQLAVVGKLHILRHDSTMVAGLR